MMFELHDRRVCASHNWFRRASIHKQSVHEVYNIIHLSRKKGQIELTSPPRARARNPPLDYLIGRLALLFGLCSNYEFRKRQCLIYD